MMSRSKRWRRVHRPRRPGFRSGRLASIGLEPRLWRASGLALRPTGAPNCAPETNIAQKFSAGGGITSLRRHTLWADSDCWSQRWWREAGAVSTGLRGG